MDRFSKFAAFVRGRGWRSVLVLAFLVCAGWTPLLRAQSPVPVAGQTVSGMLPDDPSITALPAGSVTPNSPQGSRPIFDPFKPRPKFGIAAGSGTGSLGLNGAAGGFGLSVPRPSSLGRFGTTPGMGGPQGSLVTFFPTDGFATAPAIGAYGTFGPAPGTLPTLNQLMRTNLHVLGELPALVSGSIRNDWEFHCARFQPHAGYGHVYQFRFGEWHVPLRRDWLGRPYGGGSGGYSRKRHGGAKAFCTRRGYQAVVLAWPVEGGGFPPLRQSEIARTGHGPLWLVQ